MLKTNFSLLKLGALIPMIEIFFLWPILPWRGELQRKSLQRERTGLEAEAPERGTGLEAEGFFIKK